MMPERKLELKVLEGTARKAMPYFFLFASDMRRAKISNRLPIQAVGIDTEIIRTFNYG